MCTRAKHNGLDSYVITYQSEMRAIAAEAASRDDETGGDLFGYYTRGGRPVVLLASGPGASAVHRPAYFRQDLPFLSRIDQYLQARYFLKWEGPWHSHAGIGLAEPSAGDARTIHGISHRNNIASMFEFIVNHEPPAKAGSRGYEPLGRHVPDIRISAFMYTDPQEGVQHRVPICVLPGLSPVRLSLLANEAANPIGVADRPSSFPIEKIHFDHYSPTRNTSAGAGAIPEQLIEQLGSLPETAQQNILVRVKEDTILIQIPVTDRLIAHIECTSAHPCAIRSVRLAHSRTGQTRDVTEMLGASVAKMSLCQIHQILSASGHDVAGRASRRKPTARVPSWEDS